MHYVNGNPIRGPFDARLQQAVFGLGCFWGAERRFWETEGVFTTAVGYAGGTVADPDYQTVCTGSTGHAEVESIRILFASKEAFVPSARDVVTRALYRPGRIRGQKVRVLVETEVAFNLMRAN